jgi:hypothetical protein
MRRRGDRPPSLDAYLLPAVVGGGLGDIEEVLAAGRVLARAGHAIVLYRPSDRPLPRSVEGPWDWPQHRRLARLEPRAERAITVGAWWGVSAAPARDEPLGRAGPWSWEAAAIESAYGPGRVLHVSLEEFARALTSREQTIERWREGGISMREIRRRLARSETNAEVERFRELYRRFRAFDRPNVLHLVTGFRFSHRFAREFPEAVQTGPLWPGRYVRPPVRRGRSQRPRRWIWYASPSTSARLSARIASALPSSQPPVQVLVRTPRPWSFPSGDVGVRWASAPILSPGAWRRRFAEADLRIVTGSRTLLEALELGGPFLYFNGVLGSGPGARVHRPEKLRELLALGRTLRVRSGALRDLADFARLRRVEAVVRSAVRHPDRAPRFPRRPRALGFDPPYDDAGALLVRVAQAFARGDETAARLVGEVRSGRAP